MTLEEMAEHDRVFGALAQRTREFVDASLHTAVGHRNPFAPPLKVEKTEDGTAFAAFHLGAAYEGPPDLVHGGVSALILDQMLGEAAAAGGAPGMTGRLNLTYRRPTPLGDLSAKAWIHEVNGHKTTVKGHIIGPDGEPT